MKIDNYAVQLNAQYYNLQAQSTQTSISKETQNFENGGSLQELENSLDSQKLILDNKGLSIELTKAILQNINTQARRVVEDKVEITQRSLEAQGLNFSVDAKVLTDSKEMNISIDLSLSRSFIQTTTMSIDLIQNKLKDPLIISLDGGMPSLSSKNFAFDIDSDGKSDQISQLKSGSGFLALDKNSNGVIDNGAELFGAQSGDGFLDLAKYDDDNNGWIDENDKIFDKLRIWQKTENKDELLGLGEVGIGAIFLGNTQTPFSIKSDSNELLGEMRKSGFVLFESGKAGVISHIDLSVQTKDNLNILEGLQKNISLKDLKQVYVRNQDELKEENLDDKLKMIQDKIKTLQAKLSQASKDEKAAIQVQIGVLFSQMLSLLNL